MQVRNLDAWAGRDHVYNVGEIIDLPNATALARIAAGLCEAVEQPAPPRKLKRLPAIDDGE